MSTSVSTVFTQPVQTCFDPYLMEQELLSAVMANDVRNVQTLILQHGIQPKPVYGRNGELYANCFHEACQKLGHRDQAERAREILTLLIKADRKGLSEVEMRMALSRDSVYGIKPTKAIHCAVAASNFDPASLQFLTHLLKLSGVDEYSKRLLAVKNLHWNGSALEIKAGSSPFHVEEEVDHRSGSSYQL
jgi:hypothetical protein